MTTRPEEAAAAADAAAPDTVLEVRDLAVTTPDGTRLLDDVALTIGAGERVGLIGESGSGKSMTALAVMGLLADDLRSTGSVRLRTDEARAAGAGGGAAAGDGTELLGADERVLSRIRGLDMAMVFQEPMTALNPTMRVGDQVAEVLTIHRTVGDRRAARARAVELLDQVGLPDPEQVARAFPHQLSGGQRQRVVIATALANDPDLLICDEPTTALDVTVQARVLDLIVRGVEASEAALLFITHDLAVVATVCERVLVMYAGRVVEAGPVREVFTAPRHRYTEGLIAASDLAVVDDRGHLATIPGTVPPAGKAPAGCVFRNRCAHATDLCATTPPWVGSSDAGFACHHPAGGRAVAAAVTTTAPPTTAWEGRA